LFSKTCIEDGENKAKVVFPISLFKTLKTEKKTEKKVTIL